MAMENSSILLFWHWTMPQPQTQVKEGLSSDFWLWNDLRIDRAYADTQVPKSGEGDYIPILVCLYWKFSLREGQTLVVCLEKPRSGTSRTAFLHWMKKEKVCIYILVSGYVCVKITKFKVLH